MQASYTYSRAVGAAEDFQSRLGNDPSTVESEFGYLDYDQRHGVKVYTMIYLPHDWQVGAAMDWASRPPHSLLSPFLPPGHEKYPPFRTRLRTTGLSPT